MADAGFYQAVLDSAPLGFVALRLEDESDDSSLRILYANAAAGELTGVDLRGSAGRKLGEIVPTISPRRLHSYAEVCRTRRAVTLDPIRLSGDRGDRTFDAGAFPG